jgi:hypothetical protein
MEEREWLRLCRAVFIRVHPWLILAGTMQLNTEAVVPVAATPPSQRVPATPRRQDQRPNQMVRLLVRATRASQLRAPATASFRLRMKHVAAKRRGGGVTLRLSDLYFNYRFPPYGLLNSKNTSGTVELRMFV